MVFSEEDKHMKKSLRENKQYSAHRFLTEFSNINSKCNGLDYMLKKIDTHALVKRLSGSGYHHTACTADNFDIVEQLVISRENQPQTHRTILSINFNSIV